MRTSWRQHPMVRIAGSGVGWFGFTLGFVLLFQVSLAVMELGGACASGGAYEIEVECPERVALFAPTSIGIGLAAVGVWLFFSGGFGTPLAGWAWFVLFGGLSIPFALGGGGGWVIAIVFFIMGIVPLGLELRANPVRTLIGAYTVTHEAFAFGDNSRRSLLSATAPLDGEVAPTAVHWVLGLGVPLAASMLGVLAGVALF